MLPAVHRIISKGSDAVVDLLSNICNTKPFSCLDTSRAKYKYIFVLIFLREKCTHVDTR